METASDILLGVDVLTKFMLELSFNKNSVTIQSKCNDTLLVTNVDSVKIRPKQSTLVNFMQPNMDQLMTGDTFVLISEINSVSVILPSITNLDSGRCLGLLNNDSNILKKD